MADLFANIPNKVQLVEVGPRDGLQNEPGIIPTEIKLEFIKRLILAGHSRIEATSFVSPKWVPQLADASEVMAGLSAIENVSFPVLVPNIKGYELAIESGAKEIAIFAAASESFSQKNINCSITESIDRFKPILNRAIADNIKVRGYISCVMGCPYEGVIEASKVSEITQNLLALGCYEISLGDTIGVGTVSSTANLLDKILQRTECSQLAVHFHDTYGQALANIMVALQFGITVIDSSVAGLGGCPYAKGASGNVATEDVVYMLNGLDIDTGIDLEKLIRAGNYITSNLGRKNQSHVSQATTSQD